MKKFKQYSEKFPYLTIATLVVITCLTLFWIDKDTKTILDLFKLGNLVALALYFVPTFFICLLLYHLCNNHYKAFKSVVLSLFIGIPIGFTFMILILI